MLDKFIGDAIMAAFGIPVAHQDDADRAVRAAIAMMRELKDWNGQRIGEGRKPVDIGIGLNMDSVVSGNIGSKKRMDHTIIGDGVNLASRLESACKQYGTHILISEFTYKQLRGTYRTREIDLVVVKGKTQTVAMRRRCSRKCYRSTRRTSPLSSIWSAAVIWPQTRPVRTGTASG